MNTQTDTPSTVSCDAPFASFMERLQRSEDFFAGSDSDHLGHLEEHLRKDFQSLLLQRLEAAAQKKADQTPNRCPTCGRPLRRCQPHEKSFRTSAGSIRLRRQRGWCERCKKWFVPADHRLGLVEGSSPLVQESAALLASKMPEAEAARILKHIAGIDLPPASFKRTVKKTSNRAEELREDLDEQAHAEPAPATDAMPKAPVTMVIEIDAWNLRERDDWGRTEALRRKGREPSRWHWVWTGTVFTLDHRTEKGGRSLISQRGYVATRGGLDAFRQQLHAEALRRGLALAPQVLVLGDGAVWIWNLAEDRFAQAGQRIDLYHVLEHLHEVADQLHEDADAAQRWRRRMKKLLIQGRAPKVIDSMKEALATLEAERHAAVKATVNREINYFTEHRERMDYDVARQRGEPMGSGAIESTCRQYQCRFKRPGQFWSTAGAEGLLSIDHFWRNERWSQLFPPSSRCDPAKN